MIGRQIVEAAEHIYGQILEETQAFYLHEFRHVKDRIRLRKKSSLETYFDCRTDKAKQDLIREGKSPLFISDFEAVMTSFKSGMATYAGDDLSKCQLELYGSSAEPQGEDIVVPGGMKSLLTVLLNELPQDLIQLNREVVRVNYAQSQVEVLVEETKSAGGDDDDNDTGKLLRYQADYVISTLPIGVMKKHYQTLFEPQLPQRTVSGKWENRNLLQ